MDFDSPFGTGDVDGTQTEIMRATYESLIEHGYENLTIQRIDEQFPKSTSLIYQHYESKDDVLIGLLEFLLDHLEAQMPKATTETAHDSLRRILDFALASDLDAEHAELRSVLVELRGQAPHNRVFREYFTANDRAVKRGLSNVISRGIEEGVYEPVDPDAVAECILTMMNGAAVQRATTDDAVDITAVRAEVDAYVRARLLRDGKTGG